ncbi:transmembrane protein 236 [Kryptolebias marmoratus]|uniref:Transmembrane protein 236 n=1 Tax=Kryptolebias marmoratus TaxID=37003 RepID=A0A3Q2ZBV1_KRYMA|nr:transmembrane protein 236 [Kryptolebias marmoratus]
MPSGKTVKLILYEVLQFAALIVPIFVIMEQFARVLPDSGGQSVTTYWLVVASSIAYVTSVTLLVWVPLKYMTLKKRRFIAEISQWRPTALVYLILCTFPCFAILIASSKVQENRESQCYHFPELPISMVLFSLICVDIIERIRSRRLLGKSDNEESDLDMSSPVLTHLQQVTTVSDKLHTERGQNGLPPNQTVSRNGSISIAQQALPDSPSRLNLSTRSPSVSYFYASSSRPLTYSGPLRFLWKKDGRSEVFVETFMFWLDTVEMVRVAGVSSVFCSAWVFPVYILAFLSCLRMIITPHSSLLSLAGVALQDVPFFIIRVVLIAVFGSVTPLLFPLKNLLVSLTYIYFTWLTKLKIFKRQSMF